MPIQIEIDGKIYTGHYTVCDGLITVSSDLGSKAKPVGGTPPRIIARWVLGELARESAVFTELSSLEAADRLATMMASSDTVKWVCMARCSGGIGREALLMLRPSTPAIR